MATASQYSWLSLYAPRRNEIRFNAKYQCKDCNEAWKVKNTNKLRMPCKNKDCKNHVYSIVRAYKFEPIDVLVVYSCTCGNKIKQKRCESELRKEVPLCKICELIDMQVYDVKYLWRKVRKFGEFRCDNCSPARTWRSGNSWEGYGQKCMRCNYMVLAHHLSPLKPPDTFVNRGEERPPHQEHLCHMCKKLGRNCQTYVPPDEKIAELDEIPLEEDLQSVITTNSSIIGDNDDDDDDGDDEDSDGTPVNTSDNGDRPNDLDSIEELDQIIRDLEINKRDDDD